MENVPDALDVKVSLYACTDETIFALFNGAFEDFFSTPVEVFENIVVLFVRVLFTENNVLIDLCILTADARWQGSHIQWILEDGFKLTANASLIIDRLETSLKIYVTHSISLV